MDIQALTASFSADVAQFIGAMKSVVDNSQLMVEGFRQIQAAAGQVEEALSSMGEAVIQAGLETSNTASEFQSAFGDAAGAVAQWSQQIASATGNAVDDVQEVASKFEFMTRSMGVSKETSVQMSEGMTQVAIALEKVRHMSLDEAQVALSGALKGRAQALQDLGITINATTEQEAALAAGYHQGFAQLDEGTKAQILYNLVVQQSGSIMREAAAAMDDPSNKLATMRAHVHDVAQDLGTALMPVFTRVVDAINAAAVWFTSLSDSTKQVIADVGLAVGAFAALAAGVSAIAVTIPSLIAGFEAVSGMFTAFGAGGVAAILPLLADLAAIGVIVAGLILIGHELHKAWDADLGGIKEIVAGVVNWIGTTFDQLRSYMPGWSKDVLGYLMNPWQAFVDAVFTAVEAVDSALQKLASAAGATRLADALKDSTAQLEDLKQHFSFQGFGKDIAAGFSATWETVKSGASQVGHELAEAVDVDGLMKKVQTALSNAFNPPTVNPTGGGSVGGDSHATAIQAVAALRQKIAAQDLAETQAAAQIQVQAAQQAADIQRNAATQAEQDAKDRLADARSAYDQLRQNGGSIGDIARAKDAMDAAYKQVKAAADQVTQVDKDHLAALQQQLDQQLSDVVTAADAEAAAKKRAQDAINAADAAAHSQMNKDDIQAAQKAADVAVAARQAAIQADDKAMQAAASTMKQIGDAQKQVGADVENSAKTAADYLRQGAKDAADDLKKASAAISSIGQGLAGSVTGSIGSSVMQGAVTGAAAGPLGSAAGAVAALLEQSQGMKDLMTSVSGILQNLADALGQLLEPLIPLINELSKVLAPVFKALGDILAPISKILAEVLLPILQAWQPVLELVTDVFQAIGDVLNVLADVIGDVINAIEDAIHFIQNALMKLANQALNFEFQAMGSNNPYGPDGLKETGQSAAAANAANAINQLAAAAQAGTLSTVSLTQAQVEAVRAQIQADQAAAQAFGPSSPLGQALQAAATQLEQELEKTGGAVGSAYSEWNNASEAAGKLADSLKQVTQAADQAAQSAQQRVLQDQANVAAMQDALSYATANGQTAVAAELRSEIAKAQAQLQIDQLQLAVAQDAAALAHADAKAQLDATNEQVALARAAALQSTGALSNADYDAMVNSILSAGATLYASDQSDIANAQAQQKKDAEQLAYAQAAAVVANSSAVNANTSAVNALTATLTNAPSGFVIANYEYAAATAAQTGAAVSTSKSGAASASGGGIYSGSATATGGHAMHFYGPVNISVENTSNDTTDTLLDKIDSGLRKRNTRKRGLHVTSTGGRHS